MFCEGESVPGKLFGRPLTVLDRGVSATITPPAGGDRVNYQPKRHSKKGTADSEGVWSELSYL